MGLHHFKENVHLKCEPTYHLPVSSIHSEFPRITIRRRCSGKMTSTTHLTSMVLQITKQRKWALLFVGEVAVSTPICNSFGLITSLNIFKRLFTVSVCTRWSKRLVVQRSPDIQHVENVENPLRCCWKLAPNKCCLSLQYTQTYIKLCS